GKTPMNSNVNSLLSPKGMSEMSIINDRNVDGSNKHPIKYRTRLFYIRHLVITISIFTSYSAANIRALFSRVCEENGEITRKPPAVRYSRVILEYRVINFRERRLSSCVSPSLSMRRR
ncbi:hypothetical protein ALC60_00492, partial [Trachymyrmex zeteki]